MSFSSLGAQVPFGAHLAVQTVNFLILATRGTCFCDSQVGHHRWAFSALPGEHAHTAVSEPSCIVA